jgi:hypothetical protein
MEAALHQIRVDERGERSMAKMKKRTAKKQSAKTKRKKSAKKTAKKPAKKQAVAKPKATRAKKAGGAPVPSKPSVAKKAAPDDDIKKTTAKGAPAMTPKEPDLDEDEIGEEEIDLSGESEGEREMDEEMEENLSLDDDDEEDVDYLEKSDDLLDDSDDFRH